MPRHIEQIKKNGKVVAVRVRMLRKGKLLLGPQAKKISTARQLFAQQIAIDAKKPDPNHPTLSTLVASLIEGRLKQESKKKTLVTSRMVLRLLEQEASLIGKLQCGPVKASLVVEERVRWNKPAPASHRYQREVEKFLRLVGWPIVDDNGLPTKAPKPKLRRPIVKVLTREQQRELLAAAVQPRTRLAILMALSWGPRAGEHCGLRHEDRSEVLDPDGKFQPVMRVVNAVDNDGKDYPLKNDGTWRYLPLFDEELLRELGPPRKGYVLATANNTPMRPANLLRMIKSVASCTSIKTIRTKDLRNTACVNMLTAGNDPGAVSEVTGHDIVTLMKIYDQVFPTRKFAVMAKTAAYLKGA